MGHRGYISCNADNIQAQRYHPHQREHIAKLTQLIHYFQSDSVSSVKLGTLVRQSPLTSTQELENTSA